MLLDQLDLTFTPHVLAILAGTRVAFPNSDEIRHNVFSPRPPEKFDLRTYPKGTTRYWVFSNPGEVMLLCNIHVEMSAWVIVTETPYFAVTDSDGNFTIRNVPAGTYTLKAWHERLKAQRQPVQVTESGSTAVEFKLTK